MRFPIQTPVRLVVEGVPYRRIDNFRHRNKTATQSSLFGTSITGIVLVKGKLSGRLDLYPLHTGRHCEVNQWKRAQLSTYDFITLLTSLKCDLSNVVFLKNDNKIQEYVCLISMNEFSSKSLLYED